MFDLLIKNAWIVDGNGTPGFAGDVAVRDGKIAAIETAISGQARHTLDAAGQVVAPGFIDIHTHYDAQVFWDPLCSSSSWHGSTTVVTGNCGFTLAPCRPEDRDYLTRTLAVVEDMSLQALQEGIVWSWEDFPGYVAALERQPKAINIGCYIGHSAVRRYVMGADCRRLASDKEVARMREIVLEAIHAGALGFSSSRIPLHVDGEGQSVPSFYADLPELLTLGRAVGEAGRGVLEITAKMVLPEGEHEAGDLPDLVALAKVSGRPVTWASVRYLPTYPGRSLFILSQVAQANQREGVRLHPQIGCRPFETFMNWHKLIPVFAHLPSWREVMFLAAEEKTAALRDPARRRTMRAELEGAAFFTGWQNVLVREAKRPQHKHLEGQTITAIADQAGTDPLEAYLDLCVAEECQTEFTYWAADMAEEPMGQMLKDPNTLLETDAGAHLTSLCNADFPSYLLGHWVRDTGVLSLDEAVTRLTSRPAEVLGLGDRGRLHVGLAADVVIFDRHRIRGGHRQTVYDLPAQQPRLIQKAEGIHTVIVNGQVILEDGQHTGATPGQVLRAG
ncbi:MAG: D-aminoacylase [Desulfurellaceae bacterium]|nr:D-aminoacylase [Desulfurellaceae bacterium]